MGRVQVVFVTLNVPGSNNEGLKWSGGTGAFLNEAARMTEVAQRSAGYLRWLDRAFDLAETDEARAVLIGLQADMSDPAAIAPGGDGLGGYTEFVQRLATRSFAFGRPVLLINGDSHVFMADHPLADPTSPSGLIHHTQPVTNLMRITVEGSTNKPREWLRLTIDPHLPQVFTWENVVYCNDSTCPQ